MPTPRILLFDVENSPSLGWYYDLWKEGNIVGEKAGWYMLSFAYKWLGEKKVHSFALPDFKGYKPGSEDDRALVKELWKLLDEADIVIAHNGDRFDTKKANARFMYYNMPPPSPYKTVDTLKEAKKHALFISNKLDNLCDLLGHGRKVVHTGFHLWKGCMSGDMKAWNHMVKYNKHDVVLLEKLYLHLLPWMTTHPSVSVLSDTPNGCPNCGSENLERRGRGINRTGIVQRFQCKDCKAWSQGKSQKVTDIR